MESCKKFKRPVITISSIRKPDGSWARSNNDKVNVFAEHLYQVFTPISSRINEQKFNSTLILLANYHHQSRSLSSEIKLTSSHEAPSYDLIVDEILKHLPKRVILLLTTIYNSNLQLHTMEIRPDHYGC